MPAISLLFFAVQFLISTVVYYLAKKYDSSSPSLAGGLVFLLGFALILVLDTVIGLFVVQSLIILIYFLRLRFSRNTSASA
ncbi:sporulation control protein [Halogeometricum borinquense]|uniref:Sporulation control protein n=1 Tax=Halogeometricum borinquense TaxID=60847 RepID=A0A482SXY6_9EURY|nr:sporulation control protein [Halogeometricum borinquense]